MKYYPEEYVYDSQLHRPILEWEELQTKDYAGFRAKVPGGWFIRLGDSCVGFPNAFFYPDEHHQWFGYTWGRNARSNWVVSHWMVSLEQAHSRPRNVGLTHCDPDTGETGLLIGEKTLWGQGVGRVALEKTLRMVSSPGWEALSKKTGPIWAVVHPENVASCRLFESLNFVAAGEGRNEQIKYVWQGWKE